jgi:hypothetical protein
MEYPAAPWMVVRYKVSWFMIPAGSLQAIFVVAGAPMERPPIGVAE